MLEGPGVDTYRRNGDLSAQIDRVAVDEWHVTVTKLLAGRHDRDETIPVIDLGIFPTTSAARAAANLVLDHWVSS